MISLNRENMVQPHYLHPNQWFALVLYHRKFSSLRDNDSRMSQIPRNDAPQRAQQKSEGSNLEKAPSEAKSAVLPTSDQTKAHSIEGNCKCFWFGVKTRLIRIYQGMNSKPPRTTSKVNGEKRLLPRTSRYNLNTTLSNTSQSKKGK